MINLSSIGEKDIGKWVIYDNGFTKEKGRIKSWNDKFIFVVYKCENKWNKFYNYTACATDPKDLQFTTADELILKEVM